MAKLRALETGLETELASCHVVGRSRMCDLRISASAVSGLHAELSWDGEAWGIQDLGSRNGTFIDGRRILPGERAQLDEQATLTFGESALSYRLVSVAPPRLLARSSNGNELQAEEGLLCIPQPDAPEVTIFRDTHSVWWIESDDGTRMIEDREVLEIGGQRWRVSLPAAVEATKEVAAALQLSQLSFEFVVSRDGEHAAITVLGPEGAKPLKSRSHSLLLATLARRRLDDMEQSHLSPGEHGWTYRSDLLREFDIDVRLLNLWIFRARRQLAKVGVHDSAQLIERREGSQQLRIGSGRLSMRNA